MMMMIRIEDGTVLVDQDAAGIVHQLRGLSHVPADDDWQWMEDAAHRAWQLTNCAVRWGSPEDFIADMIKAQLFFDQPKPTPELTDEKVQDI